MSNNKEQLEKFAEVYESLNDEQRKAVDTIEGPVMVIAGPGTGKTQILSARIGNILLKTDALPENILCLTYTDAGVVAMRKRLKSFIGAAAYKVGIYTFHAFCNDIIQDNLSYFEKNSLDPISDLESIELFKELIDGLEKGNPLKRYRGDVYFEINSLRSLFGAMKREGWQPEFIEEKIDEFIETVRNCDEASDYYSVYKYKRKTKNKNPGDLKPAFEDLIDRMDKLRAAVRLFDKYQTLMQRRNRYDFDDMINWVLRAFNENPVLLARYQEQYLYILVDEYQDTSGTQNALVELLINYWDEPNIFVVGDDDQSIYRFQGANVENMERFADERRDTLNKIFLVNNYRSVQSILDLAKALIENNQIRLSEKWKAEGLSKDLHAANKKYDNVTAQPVLLEYETQSDELIGITENIKTLIGNSVAPGRIAVIYKEHKYGELLGKFLLQNNIPFYSKKTDNVFYTVFGRKLLKILDYLNAELDTPYGGDEMLFEILHFDWFHIEPIEIAKLSVEVAEKQFGKDATSLRKLLYEKSHKRQQDLFSPAPDEHLRAASDAVEYLIGAVANNTLQQLFEAIITKTGLLKYILDSEDKIQLLKILTALFDFIKDETARNPSLDLKQLTAMIQLMKNEGITIPIVEISGSEKGVNLLTAHGSKGLEFEYVYFAGCISSVWEKKKNPNKGYTLPDTLFESVAKDKDLEELRRLFYVAVTRAEQYLFISYYRFNAKNKDEEPTRFIAEIQERQAFEAEKIFISPNVKEEYQLLEFNKQQAPELAETESDLIDAALDKFALSVTALNNFLKCPLSFYYNQLLRIPAAKNESLVFGSAVHFALEKLFSKMQNNDNKIFPSKEVFINDFEWYMKRHRENFLKEAFDRRMEYGREILAPYYDKYVDDWNKIVVVERTIKNVLVEDVPLKGKLDKLEFDGKFVNVADYKTGDFDKAKDKLKSPNEKNPQGGDYWRQAVFYKILLDNARTDWQAVSTEFDFIEPDKKKEYHKAKIAVSPQDVQIVTEQITDVWAKIQQHDFYTGCGKDDCDYCNFVKDNHLYKALHDTQDEEEY